MFSLISMDTEEEELIDKKTISFLSRASSLSSMDLNLRADLAVTSRNYGQKLQKKVCNRCCLSYDQVTTTQRSDEFKR